MENLSLILGVFFKVALIAALMFSMLDGDDE